MSQSTTFLSKNISEGRLEHEWETLIESFMTFWSEDELELWLMFHGILETEKMKSAKLSFCKKEKMTN